MKASIALKIFRDYQRANLKPSTANGYNYLLDTFDALFGEKDLKSISSEDASDFLEIITENSAKSTKRHRYSQLKAFFNFVISNYLPDLKNPLDSPFMRKMFPLPKPKQREVISKAIIDEVIFNSQSLRDRLILELQSRCGARIGGVLKIRVKDIDGRKIIVQKPKSGKEREAIFMPEQVADRLRVYIQEKALREQDRTLNLSYATARKMINKLGEKVGIKLNLHDL